MAFILGKDTVFTIAEIIYLVIVFFVILSVIGLDINREVSVGGVEINTLIKKALYSEECFAYKTVRSYPLIIDINKFNNKQINGCINIEKFSSSFRLIMENNTVNVINNEARYRVDNRLCEFRHYKCVKFNKPVLVYDDGIKRGVLQIDATIYEG